MSEPVRLGSAPRARLARSGLSTVILEALPRLGGRAYTQQAAGVPLDLGWGWLHSADRTPWTRILPRKQGSRWIAEHPPGARNIVTSAFPPAERAAARSAFALWSNRVTATPPASDCAADLLQEAEARWTPYLQAMSGFISGDELERISAKDYAA